jgi:hypothetical protein
MDTLSTNWAVAAETPKSDWIKGSEGRKICIAKGPSAVAPTKMTRNSRGLSMSCTHQSDSIVAHSLIRSALAPGNLVLA